MTLQYQNDDLSYTKIATKLKTRVSDIPWTDEQIEIMAKDIKESLNHIDIINLLKCLREKELDNQSKKE